MTASNEFWWKLDTNPHESIFENVTSIQNNQTYRGLDYIRNLRLYSNFTAGNSVAEVFHGSKSSKVSLNIVRSIADTITSKIAKNKVKVSFLTDNGDRSMQKRAEKLQRFIQGQFFATDIYGSNKQLVKRSAVFGDAFTKIYNDGENICADRVSGNELIVDERETMHGNPRTLYQKRLVSISALKADFPEKEKEISQVQDAYYDSNMQVNTSNIDLTYVIEAWRLPSTRSSKDGRKALCISNCTLVDEAWERDYFPFPHLRYGEPLQGFWGEGICDILVGIQTEINKVARRIQHSIHIGSVPRVFYEYSSDFVKSHFSNEIGTMVGYRGTAPTVVTPQVVPADVFAHLDRLYKYGYELTGVSQLSAKGEKPSGLSSGKAIREYSDIESERFAEFQDNFNQYHIETAKMLIDEAEDLSKKNKDLQVMAKTNDFAEKIKWSEVRMDKADYVQHVYPTNLLPSTPEGKLSTAIEMTDAGFFSKDEALSLLDYPDVKSIVTIKRAKINDILDTIEHMIDKGEYLPPEPYQSLDLGIEYCQSYYLKYKNQNVPIDRLSLLIRWISDAETIVRKAVEENQRQAMAQQQAAIEQQEQAKARAAQPPMGPEIAQQQEMGATVQGIDQLAAQNQI